MVFLKKEISLLGKKGRQLSPGSSVNLFMLLQCGCRFLLVVVAASWHQEASKPDDSF